MISREPDGQGFVSLWPTLMLQRRLPGHEAANQALARLIGEIEARHADLTTDYLSGNLLAGDHPAVAWLRDCINKTVIDYLRRCGMDYAVNWTLQGWANVNRSGDYHDLHNHPHAYLSGTYYVAIPERIEPREGRKDVRPGCITFYDPRGATNMTAIKGDPQIEAEYTLQPSPGLLLLWPAFLFHFVHPNLSREPRVSISFNVVLKWSDEYLPRQP
ncbi:MAG: 2OG-Fe(II) oxygenase family protein [Kiloniellales bacterium]